jgi:hypothetical protein
MAFSPRPDSANYSRPHGRSYSNATVGAAVTPRMGNGRMP